MGSADVVPGVSGGTIAFITGIYWDLVAAIRSFDWGFFTRLLRFDISGALSRAHLRFLIPLFFGIALAVLSMARVITFLLAEYPVWIWSLFFGLIAASILVVGKEAALRSVPGWVLLIAGAVGAYFLVGLIPATTPDSLFFLFACGALAICAMILPGISGAFILVLLGKYEYVAHLAKNPLVGENVLPLVVFFAGCATGLMVFSRVLHYVLGRWRALSISCLTGFMLGSMRKIWPWKEVLESKIVGHKEIVLRERNILPEEYGQEFFIALGCMVVGFVVVLVLEKLSQHRKQDSDAVHQESDTAAGSTASSS
ncbi:MAG: DUF368 domain-containing protein [Desulfovibrio sp.]|nr:MAG: DUF368 domain-containing protein [Desulfovibrio sp.]